MQIIVDLFLAVLAAGLLVMLVALVAAAICVSSLLVSIVRSLF